MVFSGFITDWFEGGETGLPFGRLYWSEYEKALVPGLPTYAVIELEIGD